MKAARDVSSTLPPITHVGDLEAVSRLPTSTWIQPRLLWSFGEWTNDLSLLLSSSPCNFVFQTETSMCPRHYWGCHFSLPVLLSKPVKCRSLIWRWGFVWVVKMLVKWVPLMSENLGSTLGSVPDPSFLLLCTVGGISDFPHDWVPATYVSDSTECQAPGTQWEPLWKTGEWMSGWELALFLSHPLK